MPGYARAVGEYFHIIVQGIVRQILFEDAADREKYLFYLRKYALVTKLSILVYCLMENHVHLLIRDSQADIAVFMKKNGCMLCTTL